MKPRAAPKCEYLQYAARPPEGFGAAVARLLGEEPTVQIHDDLRRFKQLIETGEIPTTNGTTGRRTTMKAVCWEGTDNITVERPGPRSSTPRRDHARVTSSTAICGSDLHLMDGFIPTMKAGDILGHEFMGEGVDIGRSVSNLRKGDRVIVPCAIACGYCYFCRNEMWAVCDNSNPRGNQRKGVWLPSRCVVRLFAHDGRLRRRTGRIRPSPVRGRESVQGARSFERRTGAVSDRHLSHRLHGGRELQHSAGRRLPCGGAGRSGSSPSGAHFSSARGG